MGDSPVLRSRRSKSSTPLVNSGGMGNSTTPRTPGLSLKHLSGLGNGRVTPSTPCADASYKSDDKVSPMLAMLRMTPGRLLKEKQSVLLRKHEETRQKMDSLNVGGGVCIWPEMVSMRMSKDEMYRLAAVCVALCATVIASFVYLHGDTLSKLLEFRSTLQKFSRHHMIVVDGGQDRLDESLVAWHNDYKLIVDSIHEAFDISNVPTSYTVYFLLYGATLIVLLYYLVDNILAKSKLSPRRIKRWSSLLVLMMTWTVLIAVTFIIALRTEVAIETNIYNLSATLADVIPTDLKCDKFHQVLEYWRTRCLPPTTHGTISIFGLLPVRDVTYYLQYYSLPVVTVLFTPVLKLVVAVMTIYNTSACNTTEKSLPKSEVS